MGVVLCSCVGGVLRRCCSVCAFGLNPFVWFCVFVRCGFSCVAWCLHSCVVTSLFGGSGGWGLRLFGACVLVGLFCVARGLGSAGIPWCCSVPLLGGALQVRSACVGAGPLDVARRLSLGGVLRFRWVSPSLFLWRGWGIQGVATACQFIYNKPQAHFTLPRPCLPSPRQIHAGLRRVLALIWGRLLGGGSIYL